MSPLEGNNLGGMPQFFHKIKNYLKLITSSGCLLNTEAAGNGLSLNLMGICTPHPSPAAFFLWVRERCFSIAGFYFKNQNSV